MFHVNERSVFRRLADFPHGGQNALLAEPIPGSPSKLSIEELPWIANAVPDHNPHHLKFEFGLWTLSLIRHLIRHLIKRQFKKELSVTSAHRLMKILGFSTQKPLSKAWQRDPVLVRTRETATYPAIRVETKRVGETIYFGDESGIRSDYHTGRTWAPQGHTPVVQATGRRFSLKMISAVSTQGEFRFMLQERSVGAKMFVEFFKRLMVNAEKPVFLIVDGHPIHKATMGKSYVQGLGGKLKLFYLPPYSPHLNPDEGSGLGSCEAEGFTPVGREPRRDRAARTRSIAQHPETA